MRSLCGEVKEFYHGKWEAIYLSVIADDKFAIHIWLVKGTDDKYAWVQKYLTKYKHFVYQRAKTLDDLLDVWSPRNETTSLKGSLL